GPAPAGPADAPGAPAPADAPVRLLQLNLCGSGLAACHTGRATDEAAAVLRAQVPDLVTLNEVCRDDVAALERALAAAVPPGEGGGVGSAFQPARDGGTGEPYRCRDGQEYGIGLVSRGPSASAGGIHPAQDPADPEERAWLCVDRTAGPPLAVCTSHLAYTDRAVARAQCRHLFDTVVGARRAGGVPVLVGGDLNLGTAAGPELAACLPAGSAVADDGRVQVVAATPGVTVRDVRTIDLRGATDHPGLLVTLEVPGRTRDTGG
ncbi:MAG: endonuclease/exonuclease/phosphatase family protein, partial [Pseudonocardiales bacterium]|nr:endonuclease/exonuclease/phosphatase family protein [Pseudonocardiales bacterium]